MSRRLLFHSTRFCCMRSRETHIQKRLCKRNFYP